MRGLKIRQVCEGIGPFTPYYFNVLQPIAPYSCVVLISHYPTIFGSFYPHYLLFLRISFRDIHGQLETLKNAQLCKTGGESVKTM